MRIASTGLISLRAREMRGGELFESAPSPMAEILVPPVRGPRGSCQRPRGVLKTGVFSVRPWPL